PLLSGPSRPLVRRLPPSRDQRHQPVLRGDVEQAAVPYSFSLSLLEGSIKAAAQADRACQPRSSSRSRGTAGQGAAPARPARRPRPRERQRSRRQPRRPPCWIRGALGLSTTGVLEEVSASRPVASVRLCRERKAPGGCSFPVSLSPRPGSAAEGNHGDIACGRPGVSGCGPRLHGEVSAGRHQNDGRAPDEQGREKAPGADKQGAREEETAGAEAEPEALQGGTRPCSQHGEAGKDGACPRW